MSGESEGRSVMTDPRCDGRECLPRSDKLCTTEANSGEAMKRRTGLAAVLMAVIVGSGAPPAMAQAPPSPANCSASELDIDPDQSPSIVRQGDVIDYFIRIENVGPNACDVRNVNVTLD